LAEIIIGKQRNGPVGSQELYFVKDYARFENLTQASSEPFDKDSTSESDNASNSSPPPTHDPGGNEDEAPF
jgi:replicative DNA helicase